MNWYRLVLVALFSLLFHYRISAQTSAAVRETVEFIIKQFGKEATEFGAENLTKRVSILTRKFGDEALIAVKAVGPKSFKYIEEVGEQGGKQIVKLMAKHGNKSLHVIAKPDRMAIFIKYGEGAGEAMLKHGEICDPLITQFGAPAVKALAKVSDNQMARRIAFITDDVGVKNKTPELLDTIGKYGDKAVDFIWKNKGALATTATLTAFLADPEPFIDGVKALVAPSVNNITSLPKVAVEKGAETVAKNTNFTLLGVLGIISVAGIFVLRMLLKRSVLDSQNSASI